MTIEPVRWIGPGLTAIGKHMGWSATKVRRMNRKYAFPLAKLPAQNRQHWSFYTTASMVEAWFGTMVGHVMAEKPQSRPKRKPAIREGSSNTTPLPVPGHDTTSQHTDNTSD